MTLAMMVMRKHSTLPQLPRSKLVQSGRKCGSLHPSLNTQPSYLPPEPLPKFPHLKLRVWRWENGNWVWNRLIEIPRLGMPAAKCLLVQRVRSETQLRPHTHTQLPVRAPPEGTHIVRPVQIQRSNIKTSHRPACEWERQWANNYLANKWEQVVELRVTKWQWASERMGVGWKNKRVTTWANHQLSTSSIEPVSKGASEWMSKWEPVSELRVSESDSELMRKWADERVRAMSERVKNSELAKREGVKR
jgi:hypothetical protein